MKFVIQRVNHAEVKVDGETVGKIGKGFLVLIGVGRGDTREDADWYLKKLLGLRIFEDENGKTNLSLADVNGELLLVSQFTLYANCRKGNRPSFIEAGAPDEANKLYEYYREKAFKNVENGNKNEMNKLVKEIVKAFDTLEINDEVKPKVGIVGEILVKYHPTANNNIVDVLEKEGAYGYDALNSKYVDMFQAGIVDPAKVTRSALINAASVGSMLLTTEAAVVDIPEEKSSTPDMSAMAGMGGMGGMM